MAKDSTDAIKHAVRGMLPVNKLRDDRLLRLKVYAGSEHNHEAQKPEAFSLKQPVLQLPTIARKVNNMAEKQNNYFYALGRRKSATARVRLMSGKGAIIDQRQASQRVLR